MWYTREELREGNLGFPESLLDSVCNVPIPSTHHLWILELEEELPRTPQFLHVVLPPPSPLPTQSHLKPHTLASLKGGYQEANSIPGGLSLFAASDGQVH